MTYDQNALTYGIREYAIDGPNNRSKFHPLEYVDTLKGKTDCFQSIYLHSSEIEKYYHARETTTGKPGLTGYKGSVSCDTLTIDIDVKGDLQRAQFILKGILFRLEHDFGVDCHQLRINFSGNKGFHIDIPAILFGGFTPSPDLPKLHSIIVRQLALNFEDAVDLDIYYTIGLIRIENTIHSSSGLYSIPLTYEEVNELAIDEIKALAAGIRNLPKVDPATFTFVQKLVDLKERSIIELQTSPLVSTNSEVISYTSADPRYFGTMLKHCKVLKEIKRKSSEKEVVGHSDRIFLGTVATAFGKDGVKKVHEILQSQANYDPEKTEFYMNTMAQNTYKPTLCNNICGQNNLCEAMKAINKRSPIAFAYTYDPDVDEKVKSFVETFVIERITRHFDNLIFAKTDQTFYRYESGVYNPLTEDDVKSALEDFLPFYLPKKLITNTRLNGLVERLKTMRTIRYEGTFNAEIFKVNLQNGLYNLKTGILEPHTPAYKSNIQLPFVYDPTAECPVFDEFILDIFAKDQDVVDYILKYWCYLLLPTYNFQKVLVWLGSGRNGKGTLSRIIQNMLGTKNIAFQDLHDLAKHRFAAKSLKDKLVNFSSELKTDDLELGMIKKLSGGDYISADVKFKDEVVFNNIARLIIMANELPRFSDVGNSITQRFEFIKFPKEYNGTDVDTMLDSKLQSELSGIFNKVIAMIDKIIQADGSIFFDAPGCITENKKAALSDLSNVIEFVESQCQKMPDFHCYLSDLYNKYTVWTKDSGYKASGKKNFRGVLEGTLKYKVYNCTKHQNSVCIEGLF
jgi:P4 family phage/plasmid primase-like protien